MKFRNLRVDAHGGIVRARLGLEERVSVVLGAHRSGKTSLLDALRTACLWEHGSPRAVPAGSPPQLRQIEVEVEGGGQRARIRVLPEFSPYQYTRVARVALGSPDLLDMLLTPEHFLDVARHLRKRVVVGSVALDAQALVGRLRALQIPSHHGLVEAMTGDFPAALARVEAARRVLESGLVRVSEPEDPLVETSKGTSRVSGLPPLADLEAALTPLTDRLTAMGAMAAATPGGDDPIAVTAALVARLEVAVADRQAEQDALGWTPEDDTRYERRIPALETARGALAVAEQRAHAAAESVAYLANLEDADSASLPTCPTCHHQPSETARPGMLRARAAASNTLAAANKAVWEAQQAIKTMEAQNAALEARAKAFTLKETATGDAATALHAARQALASVTEHEGERQKVREELAALRDRVSRGQGLVALRRTYDDANATYAAAEATRLAGEAVAQRYRDAEKMLAAALDGRADVELGSAIAQFNALAAQACEHLFGPGGAVVSMDEDGDLLLRNVPAERASSSERFLASVAFGHALAVLSEARVLVIDGLEQAGSENVDRILAWLLEVGAEYENLLVTLTPDGVTPAEMAAARTGPERPHVRYYPLVEGVVEALAQPEVSA